jgi:hypothetical protein
MRTVLSLSTGAIVFSVTFLHDVVHVGENSSAKPSVLLAHTGLVVGAWLALLASMIASLVFLFFHALSTKYENAFSNPMTAAAVVGNLGLLVGLLSLVWFAMENLPG